MKLPRRISEILDKKEKFLLSREERLNSVISKMQDQLLSKVTAEIIPKLDITGGKIKNTLNNYRLLQSLDKMYKDFENGSRLAFVTEIGNTTNGIAALNKSFFTLSMGLELPELFEAIVADTSKKIGLRLGLSGGNIVSGGFLETLIKNEGLLLELKQFMAQSVTSQMPMKSFINGMNTLITGSGTETGGIEKQFKRYAHDIYMQYDSAYASTLADKVGMRYFVYQGGLIEDSRDFCVAHNNKVWSITEAEDWINWTPSIGDYPAGYKIKSKHPEDVPSYLDYPGYSPLIDRGGYNCRHYIGFIMDALAYKLRPELKNE
jgi:hypothetical protein